MLLAVNSRQRFLSVPIFHILDGTSGFVTGGIHQLNVDLTPLWDFTAQVKITTPIKMEVLTQYAHAVETTSYRRQCDVVTSH